MYNHPSKIKIIALIFFPIFFVFLGFNNVSAVSDVSYTSTYNGSSFPQVGNFCNNNDANLPNCSDYQYLTIESSTLTTQNLISADGQARATAMAYSDYSIIKLPSDWTRVGFFGASISGKSTSDYIKFTLSESLPGSVAPTGSLTITENGTFDVSEVASVNVNVPQDVTEIIEDPVSNDFHKIFMTVVTGIIPAFAIFVIVWFAIDLMSSLFFGKGK